MEETIELLFGNRQPSYSQPYEESYEWRKAA